MENMEFISLQDLIKIGREDLAIPRIAEEIGKRVTKRQIKAAGDLERYIAVMFKRYNITVIEVIDLIVDGLKKGTFNPRDYLL